MRERKELIFRKTVNRFGRRIVFEKRASGGLGRFGGGWDFKVGPQWGSNTIIWNLLVMTIRVERKKR